METVKYVFMYELPPNNSVFLKKNFLETEPGIVAGRGHVTNICQGMKRNV